MAMESRTPQREADGVSRRSVIRTAAVAGAAAAAGIGLVACGGDNDSAGDGSGSGGNANPAPDTGAGTTGGGSAGALAKTADIPVGGGKVIDQKIVVTQPSAGEFVAFSAICTHQGCPVNEVADGTIKCPCHGSMFSAKDGSVTAGPAAKSLEKINVTVQGDSIVQS